MSIKVSKATLGCLCLLSYVCLFTYQLYGQSGIEEQQMDPRIIFYRNTGAMKSATACKISANNSLICKLRNKTAWVSSLKQGTYTFKVLMTVDNEEGRLRKIHLENGKLYLCEVKLARKGQKQSLPSAGYYFDLHFVEERRLKSQLKRKIVAELLKEALFEELKATYGIE